MFICNVCSGLYRVDCTYRVSFTRYAAIQLALARLQFTLKHYCFFPGRSRDHLEIRVSGFRDTPVLPSRRGSWRLSTAAPDLRRLARWHEGDLVA